MATAMPMVTDGQMSDTAIQLMLCTPWQNSSSSYRTSIRDAFDINVSFTRNEAGALSFKTFKGSPGQELLHRMLPENISDWDKSTTEEYSIAVRIWDWRTNEWVEPRYNARFVVSNWEEDTADGSNVITYECVQEVQLLNKMVLLGVSNATQLNRDYDRAKENYEEQEREYDQLMNEAIRLSNEVKKDRFGHTRGHFLIGYRGTDWIHKRYRSMPWGTMTVCHMRNRIMIYQPSTGKWLRLTHNSGSDTDHQRQRLLELGRSIRTVRRRLENARSAYARAERAARETSRDGTRFFYNRTPARVLATAWTEAGDRDRGRRYPPGPHSEGTPANQRRTNQAKGFWRDWSNTHTGTSGTQPAPHPNGGGKSWLRVTNPGQWEFPLGMGFLDMVQDFTERGEIDWLTRGRTFSIVPAGDLEVDQSRRVAIKLGESVIEAVERGSRMEHHSQTYVMAGSRKMHGFEWGPSLETNATPWGYWEASVSESDAESRSQAQELTRKLREENHHREVRESTRRIIVGRNTPLPMVDFLPHHWVSVYDHDSSLSKRIVDQVILSYNTESNPGLMEATLVMGTRRQRRFTQFARTLSKTLSGLDHIQGHIPSVPRPEEPEIPQDALYGPPITDISAAIRFDPSTGEPTVVLRAQWVDSMIPEPEDAGENEDPSQDEDDDGSNE